MHTACCAPQRENKNKKIFGFTATPVVVLRRSLHMRRINLKKFQSAAVISFGPSSEAAPSTATPLVADYWIGSEKELTPCGPSNQICYNFICSSATKSPARLHLAVHPLALCAAFLRFFLRHRKKIANFGHVFNCGISACWLRALLVYPTSATAVIQST